MADTNGPFLQKLLVSGYAEIRRRLTRRLGSEELASEILHETYLRLDRVRETVALLRPDDYIFRVALNIASDRRRSDKRRLTYSEVEALYHFVDAAVDGEQEVEARSELAALASIFEKLTPRQRAIVIAVRVDGATHAEIAKRFNISERMVDKDLRRALEFCAEHLERVLRRKCVSRPRETSTD